MSHGRDVHDRRRRVLYSAHQAEQAPAASRRESARLREARRPQAAYGVRVERRLQGRWFSLVPVRRRSLVAATTAVALLTLLLCGAHYAAVAWPAIAYQPEIARPLRLDRPDSFGRWFLAALLVASAVSSLLIYQLRRYRLDDYHGRYRLWRLVLLILLLASVNAAVGLIDWGGALLDASFGQRVALSGSDWIRLVLSLAGFVLALRLLVEVRRCRLALISLLAACGLLAIPEAANWHVLQVESVGVWTLVTAAPLLGCAALWIGLIGYLRMLYREVLDIEEPESVRDKFQQLCRQLSMRLDRLATAAEESESNAGDSKESEPRRWLRRGKAGAKDKTAAAARSSKKDRKSSSQAKPAKKRGWFGSRSDKPEKGGDDKRSAQADQPAESSKKSRRFSMRLAPPQTSANGARSAQSSDADAAPKTDDRSVKKKSSSGWLRRDKSRQEEQDQTDPRQAKPKPKPGSAAASQTSADNEQADTSEIDWSSLSKAERRRLRKQLKRRNRAA